MDELEQQQRLRELNLALSELTGTVNVAEKAVERVVDRLGFGDNLKKKAEDRAVAEEKATTAVDNAYYVRLQMGGATSPIKVELDMPATMLQVPTVDVQDVISTTLNFTAQAYDLIGSTNTASAFNIDNTNELVVRYFAA